MIIVERKPARFHPDYRRVIIRFFDNGPERSEGLIRKIMELNDNEVDCCLTEILRDFAKRHRNLTSAFLAHFEHAKEILKDSSLNFSRMKEHRKLLIGAYFSREYSIESAAFFNPSMVEAPDQSGLEDGSKRVFISFRATGEGHISSIVFRCGVIDYKNEIHFEKGRRYIDEPEIVRRHSYDKRSFLERLQEMNVAPEIISMVTKPLGEKFIYGELLKSTKETLQQNNLDETRRRAVEKILWMADSHYKVTFSRDTDISERVIFPVSYTERQGIEDARFVKFVDDGGRVLYYATYTAHDGHAILPKLIVTEDFYHFEIKPLHGKGAQNKNLALFPKKINGQYVMLSRLDGVNSYIGFSNNLTLWEEPVKLQSPEHPWEFIQIGNCGAPLETSRGWLVISHGVGPMRRYCLGASLLDLENPTREIGRLKEPILVPNNKERDGYVPNVVYSCGALVHNKKVFIPYGFSDIGAGILTFDLDNLLERLSASS